MFHEHEDMKAPGVCPDGPSGRHMFGPSVRVKTPGSHTKHLLWLLVILLAGRASCDYPSPLSTTTNAQTSVYYVVDITVDVTGRRMNESEIYDWLDQILQNNLESCVPPNHVEPTAPQTTSASTYRTTAGATLQRHNTTTALKSTAAATTPAPMKNNGSSPSLPGPAMIPTPSSGGGKDRPSNSPNANSNSNRQHMVDAVTQARRISNDEATGLIQGMEVRCMETLSRNTSCIVLLQLRQCIPADCILTVLSAASKSSSDVHVVGNRADRTSPIPNMSDSNSQEESGCIYDGGTDALCKESVSNSTQCVTGNSCNCSAYCNGTDAYYTFEISIKDPAVNISYVSSLISKLKQTPNCSATTEVSCASMSVIASEYKDSNLTCENTPTNLQSCRVILGFTHEVPICALSAFVINLFQSGQQIGFDGLVTRAAICGNSLATDNPLNSEFRWVRLNLRPEEFCVAVPRLNIINCQNGVNAVVILEEQCVHNQFTTPGPNVTTTQPNTTTSSVIPTTNTTAKAPNTTTTTTTGTTTHSLNTTTTTTNGSVSESPATTESADGKANSLLDQTKDVSRLNASQVDELVSQLESLLSGPTVSLELGNTSIHIVSNLLDASPETLSDSSNRIIGIVDTVALKLVLDEEPETLLSPAVALSVKPADGSNFQETFFSISDPTNVQVRGNPRSKRSLRKDSSTPQGSIKLPPTITGNLTSQEQQLASRVQFNFYQKSTVFQDRSLGERKLNSGILGASVANLSITGLQEDVIIHLRNKEPVPANFESKCVFWDFTLNDGAGGWNSSGCFVRNSTDNETVCSCNHLTSFAILLDISRTPLTSRLQATILTFITYIGCGVSAIFLSITLLTYLAFGKLRKDIPSKILIQLCLALLLLNLVFLVDAWLALYPEAVGLCISTAWFLHYFLLVAFTWMGLEAVHMYLALVKVFNSYISRYMLKFSLVGWGVPMIVVIIVIAIDKDNYGLISYGKFTNGTSDDFCWLKNDIAFYVAVVAYFCVIFLFNFIMFIVVLVQLCRIKRQNPHNALHRTSLQDARSVAGITILLGLTWGFAFFAWGPLNLPFMYLFAIFNSLQGFFIFVFHCAAKENVRRQWRTYLCCGRMRLAENSEWSRTATQKTVKKSSVTRVTSLHSSKSSKSNNSSSSSTFLVSESSEHINGIGSPFDERAITADEDHSVDVILNEINSRYRNQQAT